MPKEIVPITDNVTPAKARLPGHLNELAAPNFNDFIEVFSARWNDIDGLWLELRKKTSINTAVGVQLDVIGVILNLPRVLGEIDPEYRVRLQGNVASLARSGEPETVIVNYLLITQADNVLLDEVYPAAIILTAFKALDTPELDSTIIDTMTRLVAAGINLSLQIVEGNALIYRDAIFADPNGSQPDDLDHGYGDEADADENGSIPPGPGKGGNFARLLDC